MVFFSVIIPLYNKAPYVEKALRSVASQTFADYELIVIDDGSKDESASVAERVLNDCWLSRSKSQSVRLIRQSNAGVSIARNNGVAVSHGEYLCFLDADDWWEPIFLERMKVLVEEYSEARLFAVNYNYIKNGKAIVKLNIPTGYFNYCKAYAETLCMPVTSISVCLSKITFEEFNGFNPKLRLGEDFDLWIRIALKYKVAFLNEPLSNYNQDVEIANRGTRRLQKPESHMLWNLDYLDEEEKHNPEYKQLIDNLRVYGLYPYFLSKEYHYDAKEQLDKVDWEKQDSSLSRKYRMPLFYLRAENIVLKFGSKVKQKLLKYL